VVAKDAGMKDGLQQQLKIFSAFSNELQGG
jgi:hypothetical protein